MSIVSNTMRWVRLECQRNNRKQISVIFDMTLNYMIYGVFPQEYFHFGFYKKSGADKRTYFTTKQYTKKRRELSNPQYERVIFEDKYVFSKVFSDFYGRRCIRIDKHSEKKDIIKFIESVRKFVYKPSKGCEGRGIKKYDIDELSTEKIYSEIMGGITEAILDEWIEQDSRMSELYSEGVNCIRITSFRNGDKFKIIDARLSVGTETDIVNGTYDNCLMALIDVECGKIISDFSNTELEIFEKHPVTGFRPRGQIIPEWGDMIELIEKASRIVPQVAYVGWDVALSTKGPVLIEGNHCGVCTTSQYCTLQSGTRGSRSSWEI